MNNIHISEKENVRILESKYLRRPKGLPMYLLYKRVSILFNFTNEQIIIIIIISRNKVSSSMDQIAPN